MSSNQNWFLETIRGDRVGIVASTTRLLLFTMSLVYRVAIRIRNWAYDSGWKQIHQVDFPVISVGNLTTGGTGKTPHVIWLADQLKTHHRVTVISRGYGSLDGQLNDEGMEIELRCPEIELIQNPNRVAAATQLAGKQDAVAILDDGFQHRRLHRDLNIMLVDSTNPFGHGFLLPRGLMREPISSARRSDLIILTRCNLVEPEIRRDIRMAFEQVHPALNWVETELKLLGWQDIQNVVHDLNKLDEIPVLAFSAIGNHDGFIKTLREINLNIVGDCPFPDHHNYTSNDMSRIFEMARLRGAHAVVCTMKDLVKIRKDCDDGLSIFALLTGINVISGAQELSERLMTTLPKLKNARRNEPPKTLSHG